MGKRMMKKVLKWILLTLLVLTALVFYTKGVLDYGEKKIVECRLASQDLGYDPSYQITVYGGGTIEVSRFEYKIVETLIPGTDIKNYSIGELMLLDHGSKKLSLPEYAQLLRGIFQLRSTPPIYSQVQDAHCVAEIHLGDAVYRGSYDRNSSRKYGNKHLSNLVDSLIEFSPVEIKMW